MELYFPPKPNSPLFLGAATGATTFLPATALAAGLATTLATGFAATLATTFAAGFATTFPLAGAAAGLTSAFLPKALNGLAFFTGAGGVTGAATFFAPPPNIASKGDGGILEPGQLKEGIAWMAVCKIGRNIEFLATFICRVVVEVWNDVPEECYILFDTCLLTLPVWGANPIATATMARRTIRVAYIFSLVDGINLRSLLLQKYPKHNECYRPIEMEMSRVICFD